MAKTNWSFTQESLDCFDKSILHVMGSKCTGRALCTWTPGAGVQVHRESPVHLDPGAQPLKLQHVLQLQLPSDDVTPISNSLCSF